MRKWGESMLKFWSYFQGKESIRQILAQPVRQLTNEEIQIVKQFTEMLKLPDFKDYPSKLVKLAVQKQEKVYILQNPWKDSIWASLAREGYIILQVLDMPTDRWKGVIVWDPVNRIGKFVNYERSLVSYDRVVVDDSVTGWMVLRYQLNGQETGIVYIRRTG